MYPCPLKTLLYNQQLYDTPRLLAQSCYTPSYAITPLNIGVPPYYTSNSNEYYRQEFSPVHIKITKAQENLRNTIRMLWEQHDVWTRAAITSIALDLPDMDLVIKRLLRNPVDFQRALYPYYGGDISSKFSDLLKSHLVIAAQIIKATKAGDNKSAAEAEKEWYANADEIAALLGYINPYWTKESWKVMLHNHFALVKAEAVDMLTKNYAAAITVYDEIERQSLGMADMMAEGIVKQFPHEFME